MSEENHSLPVLLEQRLGGMFKLIDDQRGEVAVEVPRQQLIAVCRVLRDDTALQFGQLVDLCGVDYLGFGSSEWETSESATLSGFSRGVDTAGYDQAAVAANRFAVVYHLLSHARNWRLRLRVYTEGDPPRTDSVVDLWNCAAWYEREAFDLFGILFEGHPDLRRLLTDYGFVGHPFRKDFPLSGHVEARYDEDKQRVIYEPVSIQPRTLVPRTIRDDHRYASPDNHDESASDA
jgi:NADH-quinone oxidoreductase subunit C